MCFVYFYFFFWLLCFGFYCCFNVFFFLSLFFLFFIENFIMMEHNFYFFCFPQKHTSSYLHMHEKKLGYLKKKKKFFFGGLILLFHLNKVQLFIFSWFIKFFFLLANKPSVRKKKRKANKTKTFPIFLQNLKMSWDCINYWKFVYIFNA